MAGVAVVQMSALIHKDQASTNMIGEFAKFSNKDLWYCGVNMAGKKKELEVFLAFFLSLCLLCLSVFLSFFLSAKKVLKQRFLYTSYFYVDYFFFSKIENRIYDTYCNKLLLTFIHVFKTLPTNKK